MFDKLNEFFEEHNSDWTKCKLVTTDGAAAMQGCTNKIAQKLKKFYLIVFQITA